MPHYGTMYSSSHPDAAIAATNLFRFSGSTTDISVIHEIRISQGTGVAYPTSEMLQVIVQREGTSTTAGTLFDSMQQLLTGADAAAGSAVRYSPGSTPTGGDQLVVEAFNSSAGWLYLPTPDSRIFVGKSEELDVYLLAAPITPLTMSFTVTWEEIGIT